MEMNKKLYEYCLKEKKQDQRHFRKKMKDIKWKRNASNMSLEMMNKSISMPLTVQASESARYLELRAKAKGKVWGTNIWIWIDIPAREKYKKITGHYPRIK